MLSKGSRRCSFMLQTMEAIMLQVWFHKCILKADKIKRVSNILLTILPYTSPYIFNKVLNMQLNTICNVQPNSFTQKWALYLNKAYLLRGRIFLITGANVCMECFAKAMLESCPVKIGWKTSEHHVNAAKKTMRNNLDLWSPSSTYLTL